MKRDKVIFLSSKNPYSKKNWSGIPFYLHQALLKVYDVDYLKLPEFRFVKLLGYYLSKTSTVLFNRKIVFDYGLFMALLYGVIGSIRLRSRNAKFIFSPAGLTEVAMIRTSIPIVSYGDCSTLQLFDYYPALKNVSGLSKLEIERVEKRACKKINTAIFSSQWASSFVSDKYNKPCFIIPFGANIDSLERIESSLVLSKLSCNLLFIGVDWERKGGDTLLKIHNKLLAAGISSHVTIIGSIPKDSSVATYNITIIPNIDKDTREGQSALTRLFKESHFLILPTQADCTPIVISEAYSFGLPVLASDTGGVASMVFNDLTGKLFNVFDSDGYVYSIRYLIDNPDRYQQMRIDCREKYETVFNWDTWVKELTNITRQL
jgi:alpha-maltose-1-phosphate synthase